MKMDNSQLVLAKEGVFPITKDAQGYLLNDRPATGLTVSGTIQGEGILSGVPSLFVRMASCNLRCIWELPDGTLSRCDTPDASFEVKTIQQLSVDTVFELIKQNLGNLRHLVITGGEPLLQKKPLAALAQRLKQELNLHLTMETNGTLFDADLAQYIDLFSVSPKLTNATPNAKKMEALGLKMNGPADFHAEKRYNLKALQSFIDFSRTNHKAIQLKFVVARATDEQEIVQQYLQRLIGWQPDDIMLMPLGANLEELKQTANLVVEMAIRNGWRYTSRIHIDLFGAIAGV
jgi:7-carboxy-7-deazaguanine synthase